MSWYMKSRIAAKSRNFTPLIKIKGCCCLGCALRSPLKNGLRAERITLRAWRLWPSHTRVTSLKSLLILSSPKDICTRFWKSFHFRQSFSFAIIVLQVQSDEVAMEYVLLELEEILLDIPGQSITHWHVFLHLEDTVRFNRKSLDKVEHSDIVLLEL